MNLLLDTHTLLWWLDDNPALGESVREAIGDSNNLVFVSAINVWEIVIKKAIGKLQIPDDFREVLAEQPFHFIDMTADHAFKVEDLPLHHRDPFDRLLIAQCLVDGLTLVTGDPDIKKYDVSILPI